MGSIRLSLATVVVISLVWVMRLVAPGQALAAEKSKYSTAVENVRDFLITYKLVPQAKILPGINSILQN